MLQDESQINYADLENDSGAKLRRHVERMVDEGSLSKAAKALTSHGMWPRSQEVVNELQRLHPRRVLPGPSGLRPSHLREFLQCGASAVESDLLIALTDFCNLCASGTLPASITQVLLASSLLPFRKALSREDTVIGGVRPIDVTSLSSEVCSMEGSG